MKTAWFAVLLAWHAGVAGAVAPGWVCFGAEPSWGLRFQDATRATLSFPDGQAAEHAGSATKLPAKPEWMWRGRASGGSGDLVAFIAEGACSDGMSDTKHRASVRVSLPDGRFLAGCCRVAAISGTDRLEGRRWQLAAVEGGEANPSAGTAPVTVRFAGGRVEGFGGCNAFGGSYALDGDRVTIGPLAGTMMACALPATALESTVTRALEGTLRVAIADGRLRLASPAGPVLVFEESRAATLDGAKWAVSGYNNGRDAVVSPLAGSAPWLEFRSGRVQGHAGCNTFRGTYSAEGDRVAIGPLAVTKKACREAGVMQQEREFLAALRSAVTWTIDARGMLDMHRGDGQRALTAGAAKP